jgi:ABC-type branched-subunit amino acid transport system substrate-binding protein/DNA-binding beta-propeller fold protein YncE/predicted Ser/Thr protein kinase
VSAAIAPGEVFADYRIEAVVDRGGMGVVYRATDLRLDRPVALKLVAPELAGDERFRSRFLKEPRLAAALDHPNVVPIYEAGEHDGRLFLAMRYVPGKNLKTLLEREGMLDPERALRILAQIADALDAAHRRGLVHRDVKPANVLLDEEGHAYLTDFGITKQVGSDSTQTGEIVGTLDYLAPEQIRSEPVDGRTDVYALGCVLYECLAGTPPFRRKTQMEAIWAHLQNPPPPLPGHPRLDPVLAKALAKERHDRYAKCSELIAAARAALAPDAPVTVAVRRLAPRRRVIISAGAAVLAAAVAAGVLALTSGGEPQEAVPVESGVAAIDAEGRVAAFVDAATAPSNVAVGEGGVWVLSSETRTVSRIDPRTRKVASTIEMEGIPSDIAVGAGSVWVGTVGGRTDVNTTGSISKIDPATGKVVRTVRLPSKGSGWASVGYPGIAIGEGAVWAVNPKESISRIEPRSGRVTGEVKVEAGRIAAGKEGVWFLDGKSVTQVDTRTNRPGQTIESGSTDLEGIAVGAGSVWATAETEGLVWRFEPGPNPIARSIDVGAGSGFIAFGAGAVWVANYTDGTVSRIDPRTNRVTSRRPIGPVQALAVGEGAAWVTVAGAARDGTLPAAACSPIEAGGGTPDVIVASDLPLQGPNSAYPRRLLEAVRQVFRGHAYRAGRFRVGLQSCDASTAQSGVWEPRRCAANANAYGRAKGLVAVIGPYNSQCAQYQLASLNRAPGGPVPVVSPANTHPGFTREATPPPDGYRGEPDVYYPTGTRNYFRVVGRETLQGVALAMTADRLGLDRVYVLQDDPGDNVWSGTYVIDPFLRTAQRLRVGVAGRERYNGAARSFDALAARIDRSGADGVVIGGDFFNGGDRLLKALRSRLGRRLPILTGFLFMFPHEILRSAGRAAEGVYLTTTDIPGRARKLTPAAREVARELGIPPNEPIGPAVLEAAQATEVVLDAIGRSDATRASVLEQLKATSVTDGILGSFRFDRYGDMTPAEIPLLRITRSTKHSQRLGLEGAVVDRMVSVPASLSG